MEELKKIFRRNIIHDRPLVVGRPGPDAHIAENGYVYRSIGGQEEINSIIENGMALPPPGGKSKGGGLGVKHWSRANGTLYYRADQTVIRVKEDHIHEDEPVLAEHIQVKRSGENSFTALARPSPFPPAIGA